MQFHFLNPFKQDTYIRIKIHQTNASLKQEGYMYVESIENGKKE